MSTEPTRAGGGDHPRFAIDDAFARRMVHTVAEAGEMARGMFAAGVKTWTKGNNSPVTEADMAVDAFLRQHLTALDPAAGWLSEESADTPARLSASRLWVVDPIDGTRAFMAAGSDWAVSVALVEAGRPVAAALFAPATDEMFTAIAGAGAFHNGRALAVASRARLEGARVAGPPADLDRIARAAPIERLPRIRSLALRLARVATGEIDVAFAGGNSNDWDLAAADLVVTEAQGRLTGHDGMALRYNAPIPSHAPLVCAGAPLHQAALEAMGAPVSFKAALDTP
ncbi:MULTISPECIES: 3'(2'),5'-bisphosphate nucleotidase CysQ [Xanthobacter]|uniref:3'(2'),5'-bisphosphate nucleotidase CysQ n=1 Tax=Xanthobacter TaxID=279 RepID=UPI002022DFDD|nr:3'(2'),5'-bisphosphate nucleotidase CysQ [Xanthobacter aminoxidans]MCL8383074.1 3'(2'),5'-bisphosphate nucleotidase CysQ [Xanthobacter aminoxidans]